MLCTFVCLKDVSRTDDISELGHSPASSRTTITEPKCTTEGLWAIKCTRAGCGATLQSGSIGILGHDWQTATNTNNRGIRSYATCSAAATYYKPCSRCSVSDANQFNSWGSVRAHSWSDVSRTDNRSSATYCTEKDTWYKHCGYADCRVSARGIDEAQYFEGDVGSKHKNGEYIEQCPALIVEAPISSWYACANLTEVKNLYRNCLQTWMNTYSITAFGTAVQIAPDGDWTYRPAIGTKTNTTIESGVTLYATNDGSIYVSRIEKTGDALKVDSPAGRWKMNMSCNITRQVDTVNNKFTKDANKHGYYHVSHGEAHLYRRRCTNPNCLKYY